MAMGQIARLAGITRAPEWMRDEACVLHSQPIFMSLGLIASAMLRHMHGEDDERGVQELLLLLLSWLGSGVLECFCLQRGLMRKAKF